MRQRQVTSPPARSPSLKPARPTNLSRPATATHRDFYHVNDYFGDTRAPSVRDSDLVSAQELVSRAYGSRLAPGDQ